MVQLNGWKRALEEVIDGHECSKCKELEALCFIHADIYHSIY